MMTIWRVAAVMVSSMIYTAVGDRVDSPLELKDILPQNPKEYDKMQPPKENGKPTTVHFHVTVMSLDSIDESSMTYAADIFFGQTWKDYRLRFPDNLTADYRLLPISWLRQMWRPDTFFKNAKKVTFQEMTIPNHYVWLYKDKSILYMVKLTLILSCSMNFKNYPHDTQQCAMKIESLSHTTDDLVFQWEMQTPLAVDERIELPQLDLVSNTTGDCTQVYSTGNFTCLEVVFTLRRRLGYYLFHTYVPTCLIVIMSWISFWIRPEAVPARVTLGVTSLLTLSTQHANSQKSLPPVSYIKAIDVFMSGCTVFVFCSLMEYALVNVVLGDVIEGEESALKRGMRSIFTATRLISTKQTATSRDSTSNPELSNNFRPPPSVAGSNSTHDTSATHATEPLTVCRRAATAGSMILNDFQVHVHNEEVATPCSNQVQRRRTLTNNGGVSRASSIPNLNVILPDSSNPLGSAVAAEGIDGSRSIKQNGRNNVVAVPSVCNNVMAINAKMERSRKPLGCGSATACHSLQQVRRNRAIFIDRLSRIAFPVSFAILNLVYWSIFVEWF